ncbi:unnamed protein product [Pelagomonas calceolata]|uniref:deoxyhypusine synthase n=1 Tax=Pelagomonas calceolata TaxID=35677 RepID=A0A7S4EA19_9STRA|nr:unnamed protein product [Pelagomonas calceolata]|mmetsp:Transcript_15036/g.42707  ORF Transcript_15036/g.42707 Transcript_15036/m.42707 type:complete len:362 (-) Transcript_15036:64-1149(-)
MAAMPGIVAAAVLQKSDDSELKDTAACQGPDFDKDRSLDGLCAKLLTTGFQATNIGLAVKEIERMRAWRLSDVPITENEDDDFKSPEVRRNTKAKIFLAYTSNMISSGVREVIRYLVQHKHVDVLVTTGGGIEEDLMKCLAPHKMGDFALRGKDLRPKGLNRIGNLLVPNDTYCKFEDWLRPILHKMHDEVDAKASTEEAFHWTPSSMIDRFGKEINDPSSVYYWCHKNNIPVFCPAITDGSIGDMLYFHSYKRPGFIVDIARDIRLINDEAVKAKATGMIIIGGGLVKHHTCNANLMRNGANFAVFVNTGQEFDGSDSGARPDEAVSWGKIRMEAKPVKVYADATLAFPLIVSQTFAKRP